MSPAAVGIQTPDISAPTAVIIRIRLLGHKHEIGHDYLISHIEFKMLTVIPVCLGHNVTTNRKHIGYKLISQITLDAGLLARSQYSEGPATSHLDTVFSWFPCVYKQTLRWFPTFQVAATCFSCSPPDLNLLDSHFIFMLSLFHIYVHA